MGAPDRDGAGGFTLNRTEEFARDLDKVHGRDCAHETTAIRKVPVAGGAIQLRRQCLACGELIGTAIAKAAAPENPPLYDEALRARSRAAHADARRAIEQRHALMQQAMRAERSGWYRAYLKTPQWRDRREKILRRAGGWCEGCGTRPATEVHHLSYANVFDEFLFELAALCAACHRRVHGRADDVCS